MIFPSWTKSSTPVTVTVCAVFQFEVVKVSEEGETVPSVVSPDDNPIVTDAVGWVVNTTVKVLVFPVPAASVVVRVVGLTGIPLTSLSLLVTVTT